MKHDEARHYYADFTSGWKLDEAAPGRRQGRMASGRTLSGVRFFMTNVARPAENIVDKRGTCAEQSGLRNRALRF